MTSADWTGLEETEKADDEGGKDENVLRLKVRNGRSIMDLAHGNPVYLFLSC